MVKTSEDRKHLERARGGGDGQTTFDGEEGRKERLKVMKAGGNDQGEARGVVGSGST